MKSIYIKRGPTKKKEKRKRKERGGNTHCQRRGNSMHEALLLQRNSWV